ncbi:M23 family metallopeptidase [bacterium BFN5]|nr:M23 family metallopeptidase [bacterium BFN5]QJW45724.1 M23 family metallopeptidase [bacterium BFN5]
MKILNKIQALKQKDLSLKPVSIRSIILLLCLVSIFPIGILAKVHPESNGNTNIEPALSQKQLGQAHATNSALLTAKLAATPSIWPTTGSISSGFGWRNAPMEGASETHQGIDIASNMGVPVVATADGTVVKSGWAAGYGNIVQIDHGNGIETIYGHNSQLAVTTGQSVKKGQLIAYVGSTGVSTGPHVHYEVRVNHSAVDPMKFLVRY